jgi:hypothetical protein
MTPANVATSVRSALWWRATRPSSRCVSILAFAGLGMSETTCVAPTHTLESARRVAPASGPVDWEVALAEYQQLQQVARDGDTWSRRGRRSPAEIETRRRWLLTTFPGSELAAKAELWRISELYDAGQYERVAPAALELIAKYPLLSGVHDQTLSFVSRVVGDAKLPLTARRAALSAIAPALRHRATLSQKLVHSLRKAGQTPEQALELGKRVATNCGAYPQCRNLWWDALKSATKSLGNEAFTREARAFIALYGTDSLAGRDAELAIQRLQAASDGGSAELKQLETTARAQALSVASAFAEARRLLAEDEGEAAAARIRQVLATVPKFAAEEAWNALLRTREMASGDEAALPILRLLAEQGGTAETMELGAAVLRDRGVSRDGLQLFIALLRQGGVDRDHSCDLVDFAVRVAEGRPERDALLDAYRAGVVIATRLDVPDHKVRYLNGLAKAAWDTSPKEALQAMRDAVALYPRIPAAAESGWLLATLEGRNQVVKEPAARSRSAAAETAGDPALPLPKAPTQSAAVVATSGGFALARHATDADLLLHGKPNASAASESAGRALDGNAESAWEVSSFPAALIAPLKTASSLAKLRVVTENPAYYTVSLLDCAGRTVSRVERDWGFFDYYRRDDYWPSVDETLQLLPTSSVCFVRLDVRAVRVSPLRVKAIEAYASPVEAQGVRLSETMAASPGQAVGVTFSADEPSASVSYDASGEWARGFPISRWKRFWLRSNEPLTPNQTGSSLGIAFFGTNARLSIDRPGAMRWQVDDGAVTLSPHPGEEETELSVAANAAPGLHVLRLYDEALPRDGEHADGPTPHGTRFVKLTVDGKSRVRVALRFGTRAGAWGPWSPPLAGSGGAINVPASIDGWRPELAQAGAFFDAREVGARTSATLRRLELVPRAKAANEAAREAGERAVLRDAPQDVAKALAERDVVVTYPKTGSAAEYNAAKQLAEKAKVPLQSDDIGLNFYPGTVVAVGTPLRQRYARQLLATHGLWNTPQFFAATEGVAAPIRHADHTWFYAVTGDTPLAVQKAVDRVAAALPTPRAPSAAVRIFSSNTLEAPMPWQIAGNQPEPQAIELRLGINDRRSAVFGLAADRAVKSATISVGELQSDSGARLAPPLSRVSGYYEWIPFFGDLRLPNFLVPSTAVALPENSARAVWLTLSTPAATKPGVYRGNISLEVDGTQRQVPLVVRVEALDLPRQPHLRTSSFSHLPYWYHRGAAGYDAALRALARDEATHGASDVTPPLEFDWTTAPKRIPASSAVQKSNAVPRDIHWAPFSDASKQIPAENALFVAFPKAVETRWLFVTGRANERTSVRLSAWNGQAWAALPPQPISNAKSSQALLFSNPNGRVQYLRLSATDTTPLGLESVGAFEGTAAFPIKFDFTALAHSMEVFEEEYAKLGLRPNFVLQPGARLTAAAAELSGVANYPYGGVVPPFAAQLNAELVRTGRASRTTLKVADEPKDLGVWAAQARPFKEAGLATMTAHSADRKDLDAAIGVMNPWCPQYDGNILSPFFTERKRAGDAVWWYTYGPPNLRVTGQPAENLVYHWLSAKWHFDGEMTYAALHATSTSMPVPFRYENGEDHRLAFLPDGTLLDTPRREIEAEGIADVKLIEFIEAAAGRLSVSKPERAAAILKELSAIENRVVPYKYDYATDATRWLAARESVYALALSARAEAPASAPKSPSLAPPRRVQ